MPSGVSAALVLVRPVFCPRVWVCRTILLCKSKCLSCLLIRRSSSTRRTAMQVYFSVLRGSWRKQLLSALRTILKSACLRRRAIVDLRQASCFLRQELHWGPESSINRTLPASTARYLVGSSGGRSPRVGLCCRHRQNRSLRRSLYPQCVVDSACRARSHGFFTPQDSSAPRPSLHRPGRPCRCLEPRAQAKRRCTTASRGAR